MATPMKSIAVGTKATPEQVRRWQEAAGDKTLSEWVRETLDRSLEKDHVVDRIERILLNVFRDISNGVPITRDRISQYRDILQ